MDDRPILVEDEVASVGNEQSELSEQLVAGLEGSKMPSYAGQFSISRASVLNSLRWASRVAIDRRRACRALFGLAPIRAPRTAWRRRMDGGPDDFEPEGERLVDEAERLV